MCKPTSIYLVIIYPEPVISNPQPRPLPPNSKYFLVPLQLRINGFQWYANDQATLISGEEDQSTNLYSSVRD